MENFIELSKEKQEQIRKYGEYLTVTSPSFPYSLDKLPLGGFHAPRFAITKRENHGLGYHAHIQMLKSGKYLRAGYIVTLDNNTIMTTPHGRNPLFNIEQRKNAIIKDVKHYSNDIFKGIPLEEMLPVSRNAIPLIRIN
tara:strand:- start:9352 stop:9768 length:417 start_codon:yes stop_codon:yes gene_type:complete